MVSVSGEDLAVARPAEAGIGGHAKGLVSFVDVSFRFGSGQAPWILRHVDLTISRGEFFVLIGPSGCGKTTALNLLAGFETPTAGQVLADGQPVTRPGVERAVIFQGEDSLYPWLTVEDNVAFSLRVAGLSRKQRRQRVRPYLQMVGLVGHLHKYPSELSGGMKQRVQLVRALVCDALVLLMDEPFGALDAQTRAILQDELARIWEQNRVTILFITHDIAEAVLLADRVGVMTAGPASVIKEIVPIELARPRSRSDPAFGAAYGQLNALLAEEARKALRDGQ